MRTYICILFFSENFLEIYSRNRKTSDGTRIDFYYNNKWVSVSILLFAVPSHLKSPSFRGREECREY